MKKILLITFLILTPCISFSQSRLHTLGACLFYNNDEIKACFDAVFDKGVGYTGYYSTLDSEGFYLDAGNCSIVYSSFTKSFEPGSGSFYVDSVYRVSLALSEDDFESIFDICNLVVTTSSPQGRTLMLGEAGYFYVHDFNIAENENGSYSELATLTKKICRFARSRDVLSIKQMVPEIKSMGKQYKGLIDLSVTPFESSSTYLQTGSLFGRVGVSVAFVDVEQLDKKTYEAGADIIRGVASFLLMNSSHNIHCEIIVGKGTQGVRKNSRNVTIWVRPEDFSLSKIESLIK